MSVGSISFWQQDQNFWAQGQQSTQSQALSASVIDNMFGAQTTESTGLSSLANSTALTRVNNALTAAVQNALAGLTGGTSSSASSSGSSSSSSSASAASAPSATPTPAIGTGTVPVTSSTSLLTLGFIKGASVSVADGTGVTKYVSTGSDTVGDLINALNANVYGNATNVAAGLNANGQITLTAKNNTALVTVTGNFASNLGFGATNDSFAPVQPPASASGASGSTASTGSSSSTGTSSTGSSTSKSGSTSSTAAKTAVSGIPINSAFALQSGGTAALLLASSGIAGSTVNLLA